MVLLRDRDLTELLILEINNDCGYLKYWRYSCQKHLQQNKGSIIH